MCPTLSGDKMKMKWIYMNTKPSNVFTPSKSFQHAFWKTNDLQTLCICLGIYAQGCPFAVNRNLFASIRML